MSAELIVVNGPLAGARYALNKGEALIGRAPTCDIVLNEADVAWRHCQVRRQGERFVIADLRSSAGTYVNGMRSAERWLEDRDQIGVGKTILMFRPAHAGVDGAMTPIPDTKPLLLGACALVFLFRALAASAASKQRDLLRGQILSLISDLIPFSEAVLLLAANASDLQSRWRENAPKYAFDFATSFVRICDEGAFADSELGVVAVPLYAGGTLAGGIALHLRKADAANIGGHLETLTAVATLASIAFEANQEVETLKAEKAILQEQIASTSGIVGNSAAVRRLLDFIQRVAPKDTTVLITGESGTGKELIARALHDKSSRRERPFIAVNCAALSETLFESELFGHEKGAFTGAISLKYGRFELAQGGTIFLDEVGELAPSLQAKLLRVLQQREFERVGGTRSYPLDIRVIAATNRDLAQDVEDGRFREDLYHRLNVVTLHSPPLRDHREDIPLLARYFLQRAVERCKRHVQGLSPEAEQLLLDYYWPGNVRELENAMERAVVLGVSEWILPEDLPESLIESAPGDAATKYHHSVGQAKREAILDAYARGNGDYKQAARILGLHPNYLLRLVRNLGLREEINRQQSRSIGV